MVSPRARTELGDLLGIEHEGIIQFRGVPYAQPPIGELRFAAPRPPSAWTGTRDACQHGPIPPQPPSRLRHVVGEVMRPQSEDCLTLTISTPALDEASRPVLVWLHGGGYLSGAGSLDCYDGARLSREGDLVVVGVNYRLGPLGFLALPGVSNGHLGLLDVIAALQWVQEHIRSFGGDPACVTVMGQSAGAHMILCMLAQPHTRHLFRRAILESAPAGYAPYSQALAFAYGKRFLALLHGEQDQPEEALARLRAISPAELIEAMGTLARESARFAHVAPPFMPMIDELSTPERFLAAAAAGAGEAGTDLIIGTTKEEAHTFLSEPAMQQPDPALVAERFTELFGSEDGLAVYRLRRPGGTLAMLVSDLVSDYVFRFPSLRFAEAARRLGAHTWAYQFNWSPPASPLGACHCLELPFVFGDLEAWDDAAMLRGTDPAFFADLSAAIRAAWTSFAHTGVPTCSLPWPEYRSDERQTMQWASMSGAISDPADVRWSNYAEIPLP